MKQSNKPIVKARINPAIGVARVGNSEEYFIGPELPYPTDPPEGGYRDKQGRLKRQAALFHIYGYDEDNKIVAELTQGGDTTIEWTVHVANKKAAWYDFDVALDLPEAAQEQSARRNAEFQGTERKQLVIDPGPQSISGPEQESGPLEGTFIGESVYLGELRTDAQGRLIFLGGLGKSASPLGYSLTTFANNTGWYDDISDGPVAAQVRIGGRSIPVESAWVVTGPPNYSPDLVTPQTMYDVIVNALSGSMLPQPIGPPSFKNDILPVFEQFNQAQWVNFGFFVQFGWLGPNDFLRPEVLKKLATPPQGNDDPFAEMRRQIFYSMRSPYSTEFEPLQWPPMYGDAFGNYDNPPVPQVGFAFTDIIYNNLEQWMKGNFVGDYLSSHRHPKSFEDVPLAEQPATLDKAALHWCMGGPFHPGCEMTWPMRIPFMYNAPFRLRQRPANMPDPDYGEFLTQATVLAPGGPLSASGPGDISKWMAVPWQTDTASCRAGYSGTPFPPDPYIPTFWPSRVPNNVLPEDKYKIVINTKKPLDERIDAFYQRPNWLRSLGLDRPYVEQITYMVHHFGELGLIEKREDKAGPEFPPVMYVETLPAPAIPRLQVLGVAATKLDTQPTVSADFAEARFGRLRRRNP